jgi:hypothetical protein
VAALSLNYSPLATPLYGVHVLVSGATIGDHVWKATRRLVKLVTKAAGDKQLGIENVFSIHVCSNTSMNVFVATLE